MKIGAVTVEPAIMNAACSVAKTIEDIKALAETSIGAITVGSVTVEARNGNAEPRWYAGDGYAINSFGMPNGGLAFYEKALPEMVAIAHDARKKLSLSIAGFSTEEYARLAALADNSRVDLLELNLGCPNVTANGKQKPIASFDPDTITEIIEAVGNVTSLPLMLKLSPYSNPAELQHIASVIVATGKVSAVVSSNTFPNGLMFAADEPVVAATFGGFSGHNFLPIALGQVHQFRQALPKSIAVIGAGGIETLQDVELYKQAGADGVQAATLIVREGHAAIEKIIR